MTLPKKWGDISYRVLLIAIAVSFVLYEVARMLRVAFTYDEATTYFTDIKSGPRPRYAVADERAFVRFLHDAFRQRRKTLLNNLIAAGWESARVEKIFGDLGLKRTIRPEQTDAGRFAALFEALRVREGP